MITQKKNKILLDEVLDKLYMLEDRTNYKNKNVSKAIDYLQKELK